MDVEYMHVCDYAFTAEGGKQCIIGIFSVINAATFPATQPHMVVATGFTGTPHERAHVRVEIGRPNGDVLAAIEADIAMNEEGRHSFNCNFLTLQFPESGRYTVKVVAAGRTLASRSLRVQRVQAPGQAPPVPTGPVH